MNICFSTLALGKKYQEMAKTLAADIKKFNPKMKIIILSDDTKVFEDMDNVMAIHHCQQGVMFPYHDKRFVVAEALRRFDATLFVDADSRLNSYVDISGISREDIYCNQTENLIAHIKKYNPDRLYHVNKIAKKMSINPDKVTYMGESFFFIGTKKIQDFIYYWGKIVGYLEIHRIVAGAGISMGLAAHKAGIKICESDRLLTASRSFEHINIAKKKSKQSLYESFKNRFLYHYRLNKARIKAISDFDFYYR